MASRGTGCTGERCGVTGERRRYSEGRGSVERWWDGKAEEGGKRKTECEGAEEMGREWCAEKEWVVGW